MIPHFSDHAANERTYLAWVRTALAVVGLGFLLERFDLYVANLGHETVAAAVRHAHLRMTEWIGLILMGAGSLMIFFATLRFVAQRHDIARAEIVHYRNSYGELVLAGMLSTLGVFLLLYIGHELLLLD